MRIELPLPPSDCSPNAHVHWRRKATATKFYREVARTMAALAKASLDVPVVVETEWYMGKSQVEKATGKTVYYRPRDIQNANSSLKGAIDGLVDAGLIPDDNHKWLQWGRCSLYRSEKEHQGKLGVVLTITPLEVSR
jgi:crossover junction endodeoxyribonuclease RusA